MGHLLRVIFVLALCATRMLSACVWCDTNPNTQQPIPALTQLHLEARDQAYRSSLASGHVSAFSTTSKTGAKDLGKLPSFFIKETASSEAPTCRFFTEYLERYFPYAQTMINHLFPTMCVTALKEALLALVYLMHETQWRYFVNNKTDMRFELMHVELFYKQLNEIVSALERASVSAHTDLVVIDDPGKPLPRFSVVHQWRREHSDEYAQFFAFYADTIVRLAYLGIRFQDYVQSYTYYERQAYALKFLRGSSYEQTYTQVQRLYNELLKMLRHRLWGGQ